MCDRPFEVYDIASTHGYGLVRSTDIGMHAVYGSSCDFRVSRSFCAQGRNFISPGFSPPSFSMSAIVPPPTHGPVRSIFPSGSRGIGLLLASDSGTAGL